MAVFIPTVHFSTPLLCWSYCRELFTMSHNHSHCVCAGTGTNHASTTCSAAL